MCKLAYIVQEDHEGMGDIIFAASPIEARRAGANEWNDGELGGMHVKRCPGLDAAINDPREVRRTLIDLGWWFDTPDGEITADDEPFVTKSGGVYFSPWSWLSECVGRIRRRVAKQTLEQQARDRWCCPLSAKADFHASSVRMTFPRLQYPVTWKVSDGVVLVHPHDEESWHQFYSMA